MWAPILQLVLAFPFFFKRSSAFAPLAITDVRSSIGRQVLTFQEPSTGVNVTLVGAMHYNPASINLAKETIQDLAENDNLGSVVIESCDIRWNSTMNELPNWLQTLLLSEMRMAHDLAIQYQRPIVLGDQRINVTVDRIKNGFRETFQGLTTPFNGGWLSFAQNVTEAREEALPLGKSRSTSADEKDAVAYLNALAFLDPKLLLGALISFFKYPTSFIVKAPIRSLVLLGILSLPVPDSWAAAASDLNSAGGDPTLFDLSLSALETIVFSRVFLKELLAERNKVLAQNILAQCRLQQQKQQQMFPLNLFAGGGANSPKSDIVYAEMSPPARAEGKEKVVVAVLGMAHCNGIMKLLREQQVS